MDKYTQWRIQEMKEQKFTSQHGVCAGCNKEFRNGDITELAHCIPQRKWDIAKYGAEVIHHELNMKLTHPGYCNSAVQLNVNATELIEAYVFRIKEAIDG